MASALSILPREQIPKISLNLELLRLFVLSAERGTITAAAKELRLSPSLATRKLAQLEQVLGIRLFQRTTRRMELTEGGSITLPWAQGVLSSYESLVDDLTALSQRPSGTVRLAASHYGAEYYLPPLLAKFSLLYPQIRVSIAATDNLVDLIAGRFDLAVHSGRIPDSGLVGMRVAALRNIACASPHYLNRRGTPYHPEELSSHDCLAHSTVDSSNWFFRRDGKLIASPIRPLAETDNHSVLLGLARNGVGIACLPDYMLREDLLRGRLKPVLQDYEAVYSDGQLPALWIVYPNRRMFHRTRVFIDFLQRAIRHDRKDAFTAADSAAWHELPPGARMKGQAAITLVARESNELR